MLNDLLRFFNKFIHFLFSDENAILGIFFLLFVWLILLRAPNLILFLIRKGIVSLMFALFLVRWKAISYLTATKIMSLIRFNNDSALRRILVNNEDVIFGFIWGGFCFGWISISLFLCYYELKNWKYGKKKENN
jgi:hypothetical protein